MVKIAYDLHNITNQTSIIGSVQQLNQVLLFGWLGVLILLMIFFITFIAFTQTTDNSRKAFASASFITFGVCLLLRALYLVPDLAIFVTLAAAAIGVAVARRD